VRRITSGLKHPGALAIGPSGDLFVANWCGKQAFVTEYQPGGSVPVRKITDGIKHPWTLATDSKGRLYVANAPLYPPGGHSWVSVYVTAFYDGYFSERLTANVSCAPLK
jgi:hypothetical protein